MKSKKFLLQIPEKTSYKCCLRKILQKITQNNHQIPKKNEGNGDKKTKEMETKNLFHAFATISLHRIYSINFLLNMISRNYVQICAVLSQKETQYRYCGASSTLRGKLSEILSVMSPCSTWIRDSCLTWLT
jgi:hypothetical protein